MDYPWYKKIQRSDEIAQGDIILSCPIPLPSKELFQAILDDDDELKAPLNIKQTDVIILSQACDIVNDKIDSIVVCPVWPLTTLKASNEYYKSTKASESLRQRKEPSYHLLNNYSSDLISQEYSVVDFHRIGGDL